MDSSSRVGMNRSSPEGEHHDPENGPDRGPGDITTSEKRANGHSRSVEAPASHEKAGRQPRLHMSPIGLRTASVQATPSQQSGEASQTHAPDTAQAASVMDIELDEHDMFERFHWAIRLAEIMDRKKEAAEAESRQKKAEADAELHAHILEEQRRRDRDQRIQQAQLEVHRQAASEAIQDNDRLKAEIRRLADENRDLHDDGTRRDEMVRMMTIQHTESSTQLENRHKREVQSLVEKARSFELFFRMLLVGYLLATIGECAWLAYRNQTTSAQNNDHVPSVALPPCIQKCHQLASSVQIPTRLPAWRRLMRHTPPSTGVAASGDDGDDLPTDPGSPNIIHLSTSAILRHPYNTLLIAPEIATVLSQITGELPGAWRCYDSPSKMRTCGRSNSSLSKMRSANETLDDCMGQADAFAAFLTRTLSPALRATVAESNVDHEVNLTTLQNSVSVARSVSTKTVSCFRASLRKSAEVHESMRADRDLLHQQATGEARTVLNHSWGWRGPSTNLDEVENMLLTGHKMTVLIMKTSLYEVLSWHTARLQVYDVFLSHAERTVKSLKHSWNSSTLQNLEAEYLLYTAKILPSPGKGGFEQWYKSLLA